MGLSSQFVTVLLAFCCVGVMVGVVGNTAPVFEVKLDSPAAVRWDDTVNGMIDLYGYENSFYQLYDYLGGLATMCDTRCSSFLAQSFKSRFPDQFEEIVGIARVLTDRSGQQWDVNLMVAAQYYYEFMSSPMSSSSVACTAVIACNIDGEMVHGHNNDLGQWATNITAMVLFTRKGQTIFTTSQLVGLVGGLAADGEHSFTFSLNGRGDPSTAFHTPQELFACLTDPASSLAPIYGTVRRLLESQTPYPSALEALKTWKMCSSAYLTLSGPGFGEAAIIARSPKGTVKMASVDCTGQASGDSWYAATTNYDWWLPQPSYDDRLSTVLAGLKALGPAEAATVPGMWDLLSIKTNGTAKGVLTPSTLYTAVMTPKVDSMMLATRSSDF